MDVLMQCYQTLRDGKALTENDIAGLATSNLRSYQLASLAFQLCAKRNLLPHEAAYRAAILPNIPHVAAYLQHLFPDAAINSSLPRAEGAAARPDAEILSLLADTRRTSRIGRSRLQHFITAFVKGTLSADSMALWLMKVCYDGLSEADVRDITFVMRDSGGIFDYRDLAALDHRRIVRRYPTGALSEKTALVLPGLLAAFRSDCPIASPFLVARSLGFTGGTWDKMRAVPGFSFPLQGQQTIETMRLCGVAMCVTEGDFNPADRELYQLRSVTGTIQSRELIVASIASKQLALPADQLLLDTRYGPGAFFATRGDAEDAATQMIEVIQSGGVPCFAQFTATDQPTGMAIGNALEVLEAIAVMGIDTGHLWDERALNEQRELVIGFFAKLMDREFGQRGEGWWRDEASRRFNDGSVFEAFLQILRAHGVAEAVLQTVRSHPSSVLIGAGEPTPVSSHRDGRVVGIDQRKLGHIVNFGLGAGGNEYAAVFDASSGVALRKRLGDQVRRNEALCVVYPGRTAAQTVAELEEDLRSCFDIR